MKTKKIFKGLIVAVFALTSIFSFVGCADDSIIVQTNAYFAPFEYYNGKNIVGVDVDIMTKVGENMGKKVKFVNGEFDVIIELVSAGKKCDAGAAGITITDERKEKVDFSIPYYTSIQYVVYNETSGVTPNADGNIIWDDLSGKKIGVQRNTTGNIYADDEIDNGTLKDTNATCTPYTNALVAAAAIGTGIDVVIIDKLPAETIVNSNSSLKCAPLYYASGAPTSEDYAICVMKGNKKLLDEINKVLQGMLNDKVDGINAIERAVIKHMAL